jgi:hypothetical protein
MWVVGHLEKEVLPDGKAWLNNERDTKEKKR